MAVDATHAGRGNPDSDLCDPATPDEDIGMRQRWRIPGRGLRSDLYAVSLRQFVHAQQDACAAGCCNSLLWSAPVWATKDSGTILGQCARAIA